MKGLIFSNCCQIITSTSVSTEIHQSSNLQQLYNLPKQYEIVIEVSGNNSDDKAISIDNNANTNNLKEVEEEAHKNSTNNEDNSNGEDRDNNNDEERPDAENRSNDIVTEGTNNEEAED